MCNLYFQTVVYHYSADILDSILRVVQFFVYWISFYGILIVFYYMGNSLYDITEYAKQQNIDTTFGLYKRIRHPWHYGFILVLLLPHLWYAVDFVQIILFIVFVLNTIKLCRIDDQLLELKYPDQFPEWKSRTKLVIPYFY